MIYLNIFFPKSIDERFIRLFVPVNHLIEMLIGQQNFNLEQRFLSETVRSNIFVCVCDRDVQSIILSIQQGELSRSHWSLLKEYVDIFVSLSLAYSSSLPMCRVQIICISLMTRISAFRAVSLSVGDKKNISSTFVVCIRMTIVAIDWHTPISLSFSFSSLAEDLILLVLLQSILIIFRREKKKGRHKFSSNSLVVSITTNTSIRLNLFISVVRLQYNVIVLSSNSSSCSCFFLYFPLHPWSRYSIVDVWSIRL